MKIYDVFISYRRSDGLIIAEALYKYLTSKGLRVFFDKHEMIDGHYFTTQIETNLKIAPNYILVATDDVFKFRKKEDWVRKEIEVAIEEYESNPIERTLTVLVPESVTFPEKETLPQSVCNIADAQRITLPYGEDFTEPFYKALKAVTNINRRNLWFAAHRWLENSKQPGGRFASLNINESILPNASKNKTEQKAMPINVYSKENISENRQSLLDAMGCNSNHLYLIGQGGIGKTTALMHIMNNAYVDKQYSEKAQIPLFVELSFAPDTYGALYEGGKSTFIRRSIFKQVRADRTIKQVTAKEVSDVDEVFSSLPYDVAVQPITDILSKTTPAPEYLLLLDGLNEVSSVTVEETGLSVVQMIMREIDLLISECPNVRVVLTSRSDESAIYNESISRLFLSGVEDSTIKDYLESFELSKEQIDKVLEDENLYETLQIPLFLTMYASLSKYDEVSTQGEILKLFFNERRKNISVYTMQERLSQVEKNITDVASAVQKNRIDADMQNFILDFILPEIAWFLERNGEFYLSVRSIRKIVEPILTDTDDLAFCGEFGREIFSKYRNGASAKMHTYKVAQNIIERFGDELAESIIDCCVLALGVMQESNGKYGFVHQHIRDYFAALKNINIIRLAVYLYEEGEKELAFECMNKTFKDEPVNYTIRRFMGEYLGEHRNKPYYANDKWNYGVPAEKCDRNLIKRALDIYRGYFDGECGYGIYSIITLVTEVRKDLSGEDFSHLDLSKCYFNAVRLSRNQLVALFYGSKMNAENFLSTSHTEVIKYMRYLSPDNKIITFSNDSQAKVWDVNTYKCEKTIFFENTNISTFSCSEDGKYLATCSIDKIISSDFQQNASIWDIATENVIGVLEGHDSWINSVEFSRDSRLIVTASSDKSAKVWCGSFFCCLGNLIGHKKTVNFASFNYDGEKIITASDDGTAKMWDTKKHSCIGTFEGHVDSVITAYYSPDGNHAITASEDNTIKIWDISSKECIKTIFINCPKKAIYSSDGSFIIVQGKDSHINIFSATTYDQVGVISQNENQQVYSFCVDPQNKYIFLSTWNAFKTYGFKCASQIKTIPINRPIAIQAKYFKNDEKVLVINNDRIEILNRDSFDYLDSLVGHLQTIIDVALTKDDRFMMTSSRDKTIKVWNTESFECVATLKGHKGTITSVVVNDELKRIFTASTDKTIKQWNLNTFECISTINSKNIISSMAIHPYENFFVSIDEDATIQIWDAKDFFCLYTIKESVDKSNLIVFSPSGRKFATAGRNGTVSIWDFSTYALIQKITVKAKLNEHRWISRSYNSINDNIGKSDYRLSGHSNWVNSLSFCKNENKILSVTDFELPKIWNLCNETIVCELFCETDILSADISLDGKTILTTLDDNSVLQWDANSLIKSKDFKLENGLMIKGCDLSKYHPSSCFSKTEMKILKQYGAKID